MESWWRKFSSTEFARQNPRARGDEIVEGELDGVPGPKAERRSRLAVAEMAWACGTTAAHDVLRGGAVRGLWASALGLRGGDEDAGVRGG